MTKNSTKKIPRLRFKGFEGEWEEKRLEDISEMFSGGTPKINVKKYYNGKIPFIKSGEINSYTTDVYISKDGLINSSAKMVNKGNILYALYGATSGEVGLSHINGAINQAVLSINLNENYCDMYLYELLKYKKASITNKYLQGGQGNLSSKIIKSINLFYPLLKEQQKIGSFFAKLDQLIDLQSKKVEQLKKLKRGYLQKIFPQKGESVPRLRFDGFSGEWEERKLGEVGTIKSGYGFPEKYQGGNLGIPFFKVSDMSINGSEMIHSNNYVNNNIIDLERWKPISPENGSIIFAKVGAALNKNRKRIVFEEFLIDNNMMSYSMDLSWNPYFCFEYFLTLYLPKYAQTGALPSFNSSDINSINFRLPNLNEQNKIGRYFRNLDILLEYNYKKISNLKEIKKSYLQKLLC